ncbi:MAG: Multidrug resistance protein MdtA [Chlamydiia bacterium]|nr:Multidrug resistance protein MdtA [Chlamydiia bacterium]MCH9618321.1 Multidrug resistance protein MdtA [Chlamydiia bacterium]MCH9624493.1 Multidrug resistance protein MdtA [Chlamydiia bacterium]
MLKKSLLGISIFFQVFLVGILSIHLYLSREKEQVVENIFSEKTVPSVEKEIAPPTSHSHLPFTSYIEVTGTIVPVGGYVTISSPLEGVVEDLFVTPGNKVVAGQPLFKMDDKEIYLEIEEKKALLNKAQASLTFLQNGTSKYTLLSKQKELEKISLKKERGEKEVQVFDDLLDKMAVSVSENDEKNLFLQITKKELEKAKAEYDDLNAPMTADEQEIYLSDIEEKKVSLQKSTLKLASSLITSPMNGRVVELTVAKGEYLAEKGLKGVVIVKDDPLMIKVSISEKDAYKIKKHKNLRAVAVHPTNPDIHVVLDYHSYNPKMSIYKDDARSLDLFFTFNRDDAPVYLEQSLEVYIETNPAIDLSFLHYKFR